MKISLLKKALFAAIIFGNMLVLELKAQSPQLVNYQAVIRDNSNNLLANTSVGMRVSVIQGSPTGNIIFQEVYNPNPQTNLNGLVTVAIGSGVPNIGSLAAINWSNGPYFILVETDPSGGVNYSLSSTTQFMSVPYALFAQNSGAIGATGATGADGLQGPTGAQGP